MSPLNDIHALQSEIVKLQTELDSLKTGEEITIANYLLARLQQIGVKVIRFGYYRPPLPCSPILSISSGSPEILISNSL